MTFKLPWINIFPHKFSLYPKMIMNWEKQQAIKDGGGFIQGMFGDNDYSEAWTGSSCTINHHKEIAFLWWLIVIEY